jgi:hypothetical protein
VGRLREALQVGEAPAVLAGGGGLHWGGGWWRKMGVALCARLGGWGNVGLAQLKELQ